MGASGRTIRKDRSGVSSTVSRRTFLAGAGAATVVATAPVGLLARHGRKPSTVRGTTGADVETTASTASLAVPANGRFGISVPQDGDAGVITGVEALVGRHADLIMDYYNWDRGTVAMPTVPSNTIQQVGVREFMTTIQPSSGPNGASPSNCVNWPDLIAGAYDSEIEAFGRWINTTIGRTFWVRFAHEMNGSGWYDWQVGGSCGVTSAADYAAGFNHFAKVLKATSSYVKMVWAPNCGPTQNIASFYPTECDVLGMDGYNDVGSSQWETDTEVFHASYEALASCNSTKPIWICETACSEPSKSWTYDGTTYPAEPQYSKAEWVTTLLNSTAYPRLTTVVWFQIQKERDWIMNSSAASTAAFKNAFVNSRNGDIRR